MEVYGTSDMRLMVDEGQEIVHINLRQCQVDGVSVDGVGAEYQYRDPLLVVVAGTEGENGRGEVTRDMATYSVFYKAAQQRADEGGELLVRVERGAAREVRVRVRYSLQNPVGGIYFGPIYGKATTVNEVDGSRVGEADEKSYDYVYSDNEAGGARLWFPCVESQRYNIHLTVSVESGLVAAGTGRLVGRQRSGDGERHRYVFEAERETYPREVGFVAGLLAVVPDSEDEALTYLCMARDIARTRYTAESFAVVRPLLHEMADSSSMPASTLTLAFLPGPARRVFSALGVTVMDADRTLYSRESEFDDVLEQRRRISAAYAQQWTLFGMTYANEYDRVWIARGLAEQLALQAVRKNLGNSEYMAAIARAASQARHAYRRGHAFPLSWPAYNHIQQLNSTWSRRAGMLVFHSIFQMIGREAAETLVVALLSCEDAMSVERLARVVQDVSGEDVKVFMKQWVEKAGYPELVVGFVYLRKRQMIELAVQHELEPEYARMFAGSFKVRFHEVEANTVYDHVVSYEDELNLAVLDVHSRSRRRISSRSGRRRFAAAGGTDADEMAASVASSQPEQQLTTTTDGGASASADIEGVMNGVGDGAADDTEKRAVESHALLKDATIEIEMRKRREQCPIQWMRIDPDYTAPLLSVKFRMPQHMWLAQLHEERDVIAQLHAMRALVRDFPGMATIQGLARVLEERDKYFYRVRMAAARGLGGTGMVGNFLGLNVLLSYYERHYMKDGNALLANHFVSLPEYHVQRALLEGISLVKDDDGYTPSRAIRVLVQVLQDNDNSLNARSDAQFLATTLLALSNCKKTQTGEEYAGMEAAVRRRIKIAAVLPSARHEVLAAALTVHGDMQALGHFAHDVAMLQRFTTAHHAYPVRKAALRSFVKVSGITNRDMWDFVLHQLRSDRDPRYRRLIGRVLQHGFEDSDSQVQSLFDDSQSIAPSIMNSLWTYLNSPDSAFDCRERRSIQTLYRTIWGVSPPACSSSSSLSILRNIASRCPSIDKDEIIRQNQATRLLEHQLLLSRINSEKKQ